MKNAERLFRALTCASEALLELIKVVSFGWSVMSSLPEADLRANQRRVAEQRDTGNSMHTPLPRST